MRIASLGSGSKGNATVIEAANTRILVDCGFGLKEAEFRLKEQGVLPESLSAILVTHEHGDHLKGAPLLANRYGIPLLSTAGTARFFKRPVPTATTFSPTNQSLVIGDIEIEAVTVPHDCAEPSQFLFRYQGESFGLLTDLGSITKHVVKAYQSCQMLMLECNYDPTMLENGPYPPSLKRRVGGSYGHLSNDQAAAFLHEIDGSLLKKVLVSHVSEKNNDASLAMAAVSAELDGQNTEISLLTQSDGCDWISIHQ